MQYLYEHDYKTLSMDEYYDWYKGKRTLKKMSIVLTIRDTDLPWSVYRVKINGQMKMDVFKKTVEIQ